MSEKKVQDSVCLLRIPLEGKNQTQPLGGASVSFGRAEARAIPLISGSLMPSIGLEPVANKHLLSEQMACCPEVLLCASIASDEAFTSLLQEGSSSPLTNKSIFLLLPLETGWTAHFVISKV